MIWLEAILAFALTMLVFSTMVSVIVEAGLRIAKMRERGFRDMLECLFEDVVKERVKGLLEQTPMPGAAPALQGDKPQDDKAQDDSGTFVRTLTRNRAMREQTGGLLKTLREWFVPRENTSMTVMQFAERLADTEAGKAIAKQGEERMEVVIKDLAQKFENIGESAREYYARRAAMVSMVVAIVFAFGANIDAVRLFKTFVKDQQLTASIIARSEEAQSDFLEQQAKMDELLQEIKEAKDADDAKEKAKPLEDLDATAKQLREDLADLAEQGLPITYSLYPVCPADSKDKKCVTHRTYLDRNFCPAAVSKGNYKDKALCLASETKWWWTLYHSRFMGIGWVLSVLLAGLLIGLGGPFWYNIVSSLSRVVQVARAAGLGAKPKPKKGAEETAGTVAETEQPQNPVEAFKVAAQIVNSEGKLLAHW